MCSARDLPGLSNIIHNCDSLTVTKAYARGAGGEPSCLSCRFNPVDGAAA